MEVGGQEPPRTPWLRDASLQPLRLEEVLYEDFEIKWPKGRVVAGSFDRRWRRSTKAALTGPWSDCPVTIHNVVHESSGLRD